ncbi:hypothetical protein QFZ94_006601 [Paraburkholderia sp. JPY465]|uniref:hypothetical protein n=1 Tax=Paraburkholderia sp. JPY465 TaxID=3042285 RepID=UPI003D246E1B
MQLIQAGRAWALFWTTRNNAQGRSATLAASPERLAYEKIPLLTAPHNGGNVFDTDEEIEAYIATLPGGLDEFRQMIGSGRIANARQQRGRDYLQLLDAREAEARDRRQLEATERGTAATERAAAAAETSAREAAKQSAIATRAATIAIVACIVTAVLGVAGVVVTWLHK